MLKWKIHHASHFARLDESKQIEALCWFEHYVVHLNHQPIDSPLSPVLMFRGSGLSPLRKLGNVSQRWAKSGDAQPKTLGSPAPAFLQPTGSTNPSGNPLDVLCFGKKSRT